MDGSIAVFETDCSKDVLSSESSVISSNGEGILLATIADEDDEHENLDNNVCRKTVLYSTSIVMLWA